MKTTNSLVMVLEEQLNMISLPRMALKLDEPYRSSDFLTMDRLKMVSSLLKPECEDKTTKRFNNRLRTAHLIGIPCDISKCRDSSQRRYEPSDAPKVLSTLQFIEYGLNVCILGPSDSGKTCLAKSPGVAACEKYRGNYYHCGELLERLIATKSADYTKYLREIKKIPGFQLFILDDFLLNTIMDEREVKILMEILEKRIEASENTIVCSQRESDSWKAMIMNDEVSANAIMKRATKHYIVVIQPIETP